MKRIFPLLLCLVLILGFTGCKSNNETPLSSDVSATHEDITSNNSAILPSESSQQETISSDITSGSNTSNQDASSTIEDAASNNSTSLPSGSSQQETVNSNITSSSNTPGKDESTSTPVNSSGDNTTTVESKPTQTTTNDPNTITAPNGDKITISITNNKKPKIVVKVNGKEIFKYSNFENYANQYDFNKDFNNKVIDEYSNDKILWAYRFDWGIIYSVQLNYLYTDDTDDDSILFFVCPKHEYSKCYFKYNFYYLLAEKWDLLDFEIIPETGDKIFWDSYTAAQVVFEELYKTEDYKLREIKDLTKAGYSFDDYYEMHDREFGSGAGLNKWEKIYEVSVYDKPFALIFSDASMSRYLLQELDWENAYHVNCRVTKDGSEYYVEFPSSCADKLTKIS